MDNCLFVINPDQKDINENNIGNECESSNNQIGIYINIDKLDGIAPLTTTFSAMTS